MALEVYIGNHQYNRTSARLMTRGDREDRAGYQKNHTDYYSHVVVLGMKPGQLYAYRVRGRSKPRRPSDDPEKVLRDPYGDGVVTPASYCRARDYSPRRNYSHGDEKRCWLTLGATIGDRRSYGSSYIRSSMKCLSAGLSPHPSSSVASAK